MKRVVRNILDIYVIIQAEYDWLIDRLIFGVQRHFQQYFSYIMRLAL
jgi:hypothetical protein